MEKKISNISEQASHQPYFLRNFWMAFSRSWMKAFNWVKPCYVEVELNHCGLVEILQRRGFLYPQLEKISVFVKLNTVIFIWCMTICSPALSFSPLKSVSRRHSCGWMVEGTSGSFTLSREATKLKIRGEKVSSATNPPCNKWLSCYMTLAFTFGW